MRVPPGCSYYSTLENEKSKTKRNETKKTLGNDLELPVICITLFYDNNRKKKVAILFHAFESSNLSCLNYPQGKITINKNLHGEVLKNEVKRMVFIES